MPDPDDVLSELPFDDIAYGEIVEEILAQASALTVDQIVDIADAEGLDLGEDPHETVREELEAEVRPFFGLSDDRWVYLPTLLGGRLFTHRVSDAEIAHDVLAADPDLSLVRVLAESPGLERLVSGGGLRLVIPRTVAREVDRAIPDEAIAELGSLVLPAGTLTGLGLAADDLVALSYTADGIEVTGISDVGEPSESVHSYVLEFLAGSPQESDDVFLSLLADGLGAFSDPLPPIGEMLRAWGVVDLDGLLGEPGFDFEEWATVQRSWWDAQHYGMSPEEGAVLETLLALLRTQPGDSGLPLPDLLQQEFGYPPELLDRLIGFLADPLMAYALLDQCQRGPSWPGPLAGFCAGMKARTPRRARVGLHWLWAKACEGLGDSRTAETHLRTAEQLDPGWPAVLVDLARYAGDRGDAATGLALLRRLDGDANPFLREVLERFQPAPAPALPRNAPCWCGSGRKFKQCHQRLGQARPLAERAEWLHFKGSVYAAETPWRRLVESLETIRTASASSEEEADEMGWDGLIMDVALFEGGVLAEYVERQGWLLPADELLLAQQWLPVERSVYEVVDVDSGVGLTLQDLRTDERALVSYPLASELLEPGDLICTHLLPLPDGGFLEPPCLDPVLPEQRDELMALLDDGAEPSRLVDYLSRRFAPRKLVTPEGEPVVLSRLD